MSSDMPTIADPRYWRHTANAIAQHLDVVITREQTSPDALPMNAYTHAKLFFRGAIASTDPSIGAHDDIMRHMFRLATATLINATPAATYHAEQVPIELQQHADTLAELCNEQLIDGRLLIALRRLRAYLRALAMNAHVRNDDTHSAPCPA
ncbi:MAG: hypothetical protein ABIG71_03010 [Candidatus Uhrbacteria bacterium]